MLHGMGSLVGIYVRVLLLNHRQYWRYIAQNREGDTRQKTVVSVPVPGSPSHGGHTMRSITAMEGSSLHSGVATIHIGSRQGDQTKIGVEALTWLRLWRDKRA